MTFYTNVAAVKVTEKKFDEAIEYCDKAIELSKQGSYDFVKLGKALARKANCFFLKGDIEKSLEIYKMALLEHNEYSIKEAMKKVEKRKRDIEAEAYLDPAKAEEHKNAGTEFFKQGSFP